MWQPELATTAVETQWLGGFGVRYQARPWGAISLSVRERGRGSVPEGLDTAAVIVRIDLHLERLFRAATRRRSAPDRSVRLARVLAER